LDGGGAGNVGNFGLNRLDVWELLATLLLLSSLVIFEFF